MSGKFNQEEEKQAMDTTFTITDFARKGGATWRAVSLMTTANIPPDEAKKIIKQEYPEFDSDEIVQKATDSINRREKNEVPTVEINEQTRLRSGDNCPVYEVKDDNGKTILKIQIFKNGDNNSLLLARIAELEKKLVIAEQEAKKLAEIRKAIAA